MSSINVCLPLQAPGHSIAVSPLLSWCLQLLSIPCFVSQLHLNTALLDHHFYLFGVSVVSSVHLYREKSTLCPHCLVLSLCCFRWFQQSPFLSLCQTWSLKATRRNKKRAIRYNITLITFHRQSSKIPQIRHAVLVWDISTKLNSRQIIYFWNFSNW